MDDADEVFDVVDSEDRVIGQAPRREVHEKSLLHRVVHILVFNPEGLLFLQKRALTKDENPGLWDTSAAGHVAAGEDYSGTARRELQEELGIVEPLEHVMKIRACPDTLWEHVNVYTCSTTREIVINPEEISEGRFWSVNDILAALGSDPEEFTPSFRLIFEEYIKK